MPATTSTPVAARLATLTKQDPRTARDAVWAWLRDLGAALPGADAERELGELFAAGAPASVDGPTEGILVGWTSVSDVDRTGRVLLPLARAVVARIGVPWLGKAFDRANGRGTNLLPRTGYLLARFLAPTYRPRRVGDHWEGFDMLNFVEESVVSPGTRVLVLDYENIGTNPWPINRIRDEAVQLVPGVYLGAKIWHQADGYRQIAYWASKAPLG